RQVLAGPIALEFDGKAFEVAADEVVFSYKGSDHLQCSFEQGTFMALDTTITPELSQEGLARDFNRLVQDQRKALNLKISDRIAIRVGAPPRIAEAITAHQAFLRDELLAEKLEVSGTTKDGIKMSLGGEDIRVTITRV